MADEIEIRLSDYIKIVFSRWKMIVGICVGAMMLAALMAWRMPNVYESRVKLLSLVSGTGTEMPGQAGQAGQAGQKDGLLNQLFSSLSLETLANLASAEDLLVQVISELDLKDEQGVLWTSSRFAKNINVKIEKGESGKKINLPIMTVAFRGNEPLLVKRMADKWVELFMNRNANLFSTEAIKSYQFINTQYNEIKEKLDLKREQRRVFTVTNPVEIERARRGILMGRYNEFFGQLQTKRAQLVGAKAKLASSQRAIADEPISLTLQRAIPSGAIWAILGQKLDTLRAEAIPELVMRDQEHNNLYTTLKNQVTMTRVEVDTLEAEVVYLEKQIETYQNEIELWDAKIGKNDLVSSQLNREIVNLEGPLGMFEGKLLPARLAKEQQEGFIRIVEAPIEPKVRVGPARTSLVIKSGLIALLFGVVWAVGSNMLGFQSKV